jgi:ribosomal protein S6--L-glutamate ligase
VADLMIPEGSEFVGKTIAESQLRERDIAVLNLHRGTSVISNPKGSRELQAGDRLLCYGKLESMRDLVPPKQRRKRRVKARKLDPKTIEDLENPR